jgi:membrane associated rhomboid family serine protease
MVSFTQGTAALTLFLALVFFFFPNPDRPGEVVALVPKKVFDGEVWRLFTNTFFHINVMHFYLNLPGVIRFGSHAERTLGTLHFIYAVLVLSLVTSLLYMALSYFLDKSGLRPDHTSVPCMGFSGVIFALYTCLYDWDRLFRPLSRLEWLYDIACFLPGFCAAGSDVSIANHFCGCVAGLLWERKLLAFAQPHPSVWRRMEGARPLKQLRKRVGWTNALGVYRNSPCASRDLSPCINRYFART